MGVNQQFPRASWPSVSLNLSPPSMHIPHFLASWAAAVIFSVFARPVIQQRGKLTIHSVDISESPTATTNQSQTLRARTAQEIYAIHARGSLDEAALPGSSSKLRNAET